MTILAQADESDKQKKFRYRLNELLKIEVTGGCVVPVKDALQAGKAKPALQLYLDGIPMHTITVRLAAEQLDPRLTP